MTIGMQGSVFPVFAVHDTALRQHWAKAIYANHPCDDTGCDIAQCVREGYLESASWLLHGGTEAYELGKFERRKHITVTHSNFGADGWFEHHDKYGRRCAGCNGFTYVNPEDECEPGACADCLAPLHP